MTWPSELTVWQEDRSVNDKSHSEKSAVCAEWCLGDPWQVKLALLRGSTFKRNSIFRVVDALREFVAKEETIFFAEYFQQAVNLLRKLHISLLQVQHSMLSRKKEEKEKRKKRKTRRARAIEYVLRNASSSGLIIVQISECTYTNLNGVPYHSPFASRLQT